MHKLDAVGIAENIAISKIRPGRGPRPPQNTVLAPQQIFHPFPQCPHPAGFLVQGVVARAGKLQAKVGVILQVPPDMGQIMQHGQTRCLQHICRPDAAAHQQQRRGYGTGAEHHFARIYFAAFISHAGGAFAIHYDPLNRRADDADILRRGIGAEGFQMVVAQPVFGVHMQHRSA